MTNITLRIWQGWYESVHLTSPFLLSDPHFLLRRPDFKWLKNGKNFPFSVHLYLMGSLHLFDTSNATPECDNEGSISLKNEL